MKQKYAACWKSRSVFLFCIYTDGTANGVEKETLFERKNLLLMIKKTRMGLS